VLKGFAVLGVASAVASLLSGALAVPACVLCVESLAALAPNRRRAGTGENRPRMAILVPAHDEEDGIARTVAALKTELGPGDRLLVIADNCHDRTAERAREAGAEVAERSDPERRGKGFALSFGARVLADDPPDVVVVMDADCRVERGTLQMIARSAHASGVPSQAVYLMHAPERDARTAVSEFAFLLRNFVRPLGLSRLGFPCQLTGTGMAFPWPLFRDAPATESFLVEDLLMGHELALRGSPPSLCEDVLVGADFPTKDSASLKQRRRWEHGQLAILLGTAPRLLLGGIRAANVDLVALGLDALVPPLALFVVLEAGALGLGFAVWMLGGGALAVSLAGVGSAALFIGVATAWAAHGRNVVRLADLAAIPGYVLWKLPLYGSFVRRGAHREWERTERA
jgi:cellulose synthase/poly-beta-1,6-N-acetylglucosamine synthase-like glycosyltransferase